MDMSGGSRLDPYLERYAARTHGMTTSEIRALFAVANRPEIIGMGGGSPCVSALPLDVIGEMTARVITEQGAQALQYMGGQGDPRLRELICGVMALEGISASADDVIVTVGSQQALDVVSRIFLDPGDVVIAEAPSYVGALGTFTQYQADVVHVTMDDAGLVPDALREAIADSSPIRAPREIRLYRTELPQSSRYHPRRGASRRDHRDLRGGRPADPRGQPVRPARLRRPAAARAARAGL